MMSHSPISILTPVLPAEACLPALFLDRDGTLIHDVPYLKEPGGVSLLPGAIPALRRFREAGYRLILVSNQSGIGRGWIAMHELLAVHAQLVKLLAAKGVQLDAAYYCPHTPDAGCSCRKPSPGLLLKAMENFPTDRARSLMVGDRQGDIQAGRGAGLRCLQILPGKDAAPFPGAEAAERSWSAIAQHALAPSEKP